MEQWPEICKLLSYMERNKDSSVNKYLNWGKADFNIIRHFPTNVDWDQLLTGQSIFGIWKSIKVPE